MQPRYLSSTLAGFIAGLTISLAAQAHTEKPHDKPVAAAPAEQKDWGIAGVPKAVNRTIEITMLDSMRFVPGHIDVREGDTVRLRLRNKGLILHELVLGTRSELLQHAAQMQKFPTMEHDEPHMVHVAPGRRGDLVWQFNRPGEFEFACLIPGHFQAGMTGTIRVAPR